MSVQTTADTAPVAEPKSVPQLRTILLTDLVDSTALVERLGDGAAAELFRAHDRLVLHLQNQWHGRLIDRSDGLLLLFERPVDGLAFALDYARGLRELGAPHGVDLMARAGLHVGEVLSWRNSDEAVRVGAKPLEVEGLAKPLAGRLMSMARPGQLLMSAIAEPLARRAARELGERGQHLVWKSHGRWRLKGVPEPQQIYEVGEPGLTPLRAPQPGPKAWRDIPLWRRPAALAAELALVAGLGLGVWFITKPQPAIAFNQRDWVVLADLRNLTDQPLLDDSLEQAFRISLEQSRHVNVLSDLKTRDTLARMQREPGTELDRAIASEIAIRDGARAVILPTVAEVGGRVRVSAEVIDPNSQTTVYAEYADGKGAVSALDSIDEVTASLRQKLGEALEAVERDSAPLPEVTTDNLDALRAYALAQGLYAQSKYGEALPLYERATQLDLKFALAWLGQARAQYALWNVSGAEPALRAAQALRERLPQREALYLDGWAAEFDAPASALGKWRLMSKLYPDYAPAQANAANWLIVMNRFDAALPYVLAATSSPFDLTATAFDRLGRTRLGLGQYEEAGAAFDRALAAGHRDSLRRRVDVLAAQRYFEPAKELLEEAPEDDPSPYVERVTIAIDTAKWAAARAHADRALTLTRESEQYRRSFLLAAATSEWLDGDRAAATALVNKAAADAMTALKSATKADAVQDIGLALSAALFAQRIGDRSLASRVLNTVSDHRKVMALPNIAEQAVVLRAEEARLDGRPDEALAILKPLLTGNERYQTKVALLEAYAAAGRIDAAVDQARLLQNARGLAYIELGCFQCQQALNVADSNLAALREAELLVGSNNQVEARRALARFDLMWPPSALPAYLRIRRDAVAASSKGGI